MTTILSCRNVSKTFGGVTAVDGVDLDVSEGHVHSVIGPNGAGKSTFFNLISGQERMTTGSVHFRGRASRLSRPTKTSASSRSAARTSARRTSSTCSRA